MAQLGSISSQTEVISHVFSLVEAFRAFDADNDGFITVAELGGLLSSLGYGANEQDVKAMMQQGDSNGDGLLSIEEFLEMNTKDTELGGLAAFLQTASESLALNNDELLTGEELHELVGNMGVGLSLEDCQNIIASMDENGDGAVSLEDFRLIVNSLL
ncbi:probable calcium-binding protein CML29 [Macadamia integrifolia]|uniref:probable calcium-binding protein CML29 n=1 Tax=Macadamia integrifolia TaxID=60698 RepID=UPI001C4E7E6F|nr:probable calcium-binding protein CML29 [Macadamia integrifolia]